jgi:adenosylcobinamide kinase/adenosylcobinamide-phosphate guanylyltransferase
MAERLPAVTLVLGGARSGKSRYAEGLVESRPGACIYLATAEAGDAEMAARIAAHRARRGARWTTREAPLDLVSALQAASQAERAVLVDCLTLWLSNLMAAGRDVAAERERLLAAVAHLPGPVVFVTNEVGLGIVPTNGLARAFRDHAGQLNQAVAAAAQSVVFVAAGLPMTLKSPTKSPG